MTEHYPICVVRAIGDVNWNQILNVYAMIGIPSSTLEVTAAKPTGTSQGNATHPRTSMARDVMQKAGKKSVKEPRQHHDSPHPQLSGSHRMTAHALPADIARKSHNHGTLQLPRTSAVTPAFAGPASYHRSHGVSHSRRCPHTLSAHHRSRHPHPQT